MQFIDFFPDSVEQVQEQERVIGTRFKKPFKARPLSEAEAASIRKKATRSYTEKGQKIRETDGNANMLGMVLASVTYPDFQNVELQEAWGVMGAETLIGKMLLPGEYSELSQWIAELCGFATSDIEDAVEEAKN